VREKIGEEVANIPWVSKESGLAALQLTTSATSTEGLHDVEVLLTHQSCCKPAASCPHLQFAIQHQALSVYEYSYKMFSGDRKKEWEKVPIYEVLVSPDFIDWEFSPTCTPKPSVVCRI